MTEAAKFYESKAKGLGADFLDDVQRAIDRLRQNPLLGQSVTSDLRRSLLSRFPFFLIYAVEPEGLRLPQLRTSDAVPTIGKCELQIDQ